MRSKESTSAGGPVEAEPPTTHGEAYSTNYRGYRDRHDRMQDAVRPIHELVAELTAAGLTGEAAWAEALKRVRP